MDTQAVLKQASEAAQAVAGCSEDRIRTVLRAVSQEVTEQVPFILEENKRDLARMDAANPKYDRLMLTEERLLAMASDVLHVAGLESPVGKLLWESVRPNGMHIRKVAVPFGVIGVIYEARPNVTLDVFSLCLRTRNVCVLKGGSDAQYTNEAIMRCIRKVLVQEGMPEAVCSLLPAGRETTGELLNAVGLVDVIIPRGSSALINYVRDNARVPVIETGAGVCHTYIERSADTMMARNIVTNAKTRRVSVCNALDSLLVDREIKDTLPALCCDLAARNVTVYADKEAYDELEGHYPAALLQKATAADYGREFLDYKMSIRTVSGTEEALAHIAAYGSRHSECIVSENSEAVQTFLNGVDAACVYANVSTAFTDGGQFGFGAEIGISTQKLHARGPMGLDALTTYKYLVEGNGQTRN